MTYPNPISSPYVLFKPMEQPKTLKEIKAERRALLKTLGLITKLLMSNLKQNMTL